MQLCTWFIVEFYRGHELQNGMVHPVHVYAIATLTENDRLYMTYTFKSILSA